MASPQPTPLEVTVTVQGATPVEGTDRRELFTETAKTTLVFDNGAVVNLKAKVVQGQCVFLRNERSGREILCKVIEWRKGGLGGYADLEFTSRDPKFWEVTEEQAAQYAASQQRAAVPQETPAQIIARAQAELATSSTNAAPDGANADSSEPAAGTIPPLSADISAGAPAEPATNAAASESADDSAKEALKITARKLELAPASEPAPEPEWNDEQSAQMFATLVASEPKPKTKKEKEPAATSADENRTEAAPAIAEPPADAGTVAAGNGKGISRLAAWSFHLREFGPGRKSVVIGIAASALIVAALGFAWHTWRKHSLTASDRVLAESVPASPTHAPGAKSAASPAANAPVAANKPAAGIVNVAATGSPAATTAQPGGKTSAADSNKAAAELAAKRNHESDLRVLGQLPSGKSRDKNSSTAGLVPAQILSQAPPAIPSWAKKLDLNPVVQLDAVIDANGNLTSARPISGPRILYGEAQRAVALWIFQPAMNDGKPTTSHMTLTVEFQH